MCLVGSDYRYLEVRVGHRARKRLPLRIFAAVDVADYEWLRRYEWCANFQRSKLYAMAAVGSTMGMHRFILLTLNPHLITAPRFYSDHRNGYTLDNRRKNLRIATREENKANRWPYLELPDDTA